MNQLEMRVRQEPFVAMAVAIILLSSVILLSLQQQAVGLASLCSAAWIVYTHYVKEELRKQREILAIDGDVTCSAAKFGDHWCLTIVATWNNKGKDPIRIRTMPFRGTGCVAAPSTVCVYKLDTTQTPPATLWDQAREMEPCISIPAWPDTSGITLEPATSSIVRHHVILEAGFLYYVKWTLVEERDDICKAARWDRDGAILIGEAPE